MRDVSVLIVGAGPTGLTLACDLLSRGVDVTVLDRQKQFASTTRALGLQPRGRQILDRLGALGDLRTKAPLQSEFDVYLNGQLALHVDLGTLRGRYDDGVLRVPQTEIERQLRERLHMLGGEICWGYEVIGVCEEGTSIRASVRTEDDVQSVNAKWVVGCEGAHSLIRERIGGHFDGHTFPQTFLLGDVLINPKCDERPAIYLRNDQMLAISALPDRRWRVGVALPSRDPHHPRSSLASARDEEKILPEQILDHLQHWFNEIKGDRNTQFYDPSWLSLFHIHRRVSSSFRRGHMLIAGDAAHLTSPLGGQGMNSGIGDAFNLGWKLALVSQGNADATLLDTYEEERRPVVDKLARATTQWTSILLGAGRINRILRRYVLLPMMRLHLVQGWVLSRRPALQESYRGSSLAPRWNLINRLIRRGPQPGDIGPDVHCEVLPDYQLVTLGTLINAHWALILFGILEKPAQLCANAAKTLLGTSIRVIRVTTKSHHSAAGYDQIVHDYRRELTRAYRAGRNTAILLRPDGHLASRSDDRDATTIMQWFDRVPGLHLPGQSTHRCKEVRSYE